jgi:hypothetical protein
VADRPDIDELLHRALAYPYESPGSFVQVGPRTLPVPPAEIETVGRRALLAYGANAAPEALVRKLAHLPPRPIPVLRIALRGWDVVYSAHVTRYGAVPAAVVPSPGTVASVHLVFPDDDQLEAIAASEGTNYRLERLTEFGATLEVGGEEVAEVDAFISVHGPLLLGGAPVALAQVPARDRAFAELTMAEMLERVRAALTPDLDLRASIFHHVERGGLRPLPPLD